jgi:hypothetical protein
MNRAIANPQCRLEQRFDLLYRSIYSRIPDNDFDVVFLVTRQAHTRRQLRHPPVDECPFES